jgi:DNA-binding winged helix-turn-helix (wHTH) protein
MVRSETQLFKFGEFQIDTVKRVLLHDNTPVQLPSRAFDVLIALVEHNQYVIDKDELMRLVWGERIVEENNLTRHISTLRKALDESPNDHRYIVTVPGRGYSFVAEVERVPTKSLQSSSSAKKDGEASVLNAEHANGTHSSYADFRAPVGSLKGPGAEGIKSEPLGLERKAGVRKIWLWTSTIFVVLAVVGLFGFGLLGPRSKHIAVNSYRDWDTVRLTRNGGSILPDISADGKYVAYVNKESGQQSVWILQLATSTSQQVVPPEKAKYFDLLFSRDGNELYFTRREGSAPQRALYRIPVIGGVAKKLREDIDSSITLSHDGAHLAFARRNTEGRSEFIIANADGVEMRVLTDQRIQFPAWSPDGKFIAYSVGDAGSGDNMAIHE